MEAATVTIMARDALMKMLALPVPDAIREARKYVDDVDAMFAKYDDVATKYVADRAALDEEIRVQTDIEVQKLQAALPNAYIKPMSSCTLGVNLIGESDIDIVVRINISDHVIAQLSNLGYKYNKHKCRTCKHFEYHSFLKDCFEVKIVSEDQSDIVEKLYNSMELLFKSTPRGARFTYCKHVLKQYSSTGYGFFKCLMYVGHMDPDNGFLFVWITPEYVSRSSL